MLILLVIANDEKVILNIDKSDMNMAGPKIVGNEISRVGLLEQNFCIFHFFFNIISP